MKVPQGLQREAQGSSREASAASSSKFIKTFLTTCISLLPHNTTSWGSLPFVKKCVNATWCVESFPKDGLDRCHVLALLKSLVEENGFLNYLLAFRSFMLT